MVSAAFLISGQFKGFMGELLKLCRCICLSPGIKKQGGCNHSGEYGHKGSIRPLPRVCQKIEDRPEGDCATGQKKDLGKGVV